MADSLVFDFPDPTPHFDFDNFSHHGGGSTEGLSNSSNREGGNAAAAIVVSSSSLKKNSSKKSRTLFKSRFMNKGKSQQQQQQQRPASPVPSTRSLHHHTNNGDDSPLNKSMGDQSGTTATTASLSVGSGSFSPTRLQYGDNNHHNNMIGHTANCSSPKPSSSSAAPPSLSNGNNISGSHSPRFEFTLFDDSPSPKSHSGMRKTWTNNTKQQPQQPNPYSNLTATTSTNNNQPISSLSYGDNNNNNLYTTYGLSSDRTAASGYFSEVSEFSFDRVTVTTERTGMSSNVSWNFMEGNHSNHLIDDDGGGGILGVLGTSNGGASSSNVLSEIDNLLLDDDLLRDGPHHHHVNGNRMNVFTGEIHERCDQSVISEISEGIDGHDDQGGGDGNGMDFINSLLLEKDEDGDIIQHRQQYDGKGVMVPSLRPRPSSPTMHHSSREQQQQQQQQLQHSGKSAANTTTADAPLQKQSSSNNNTISTVSTSATNSGGGLTSVESASGNYKQQQQQQRSNNSTKGNKPTETKRSIFKAIIEDIQFCGMYFCGLDTTVEDDGQLTDNKKDLLRGGGSSPGGGKSKKARAKEMDSTFLGKFVNCANYGPDV